jgi:DMSO/TMAO reductase YedYZ molybdopterin-dependent catalytic subunit
MKPNQLHSTRWQLVYTCGHALQFAAPRTTDDLIRLADWLHQHWSSCPVCPRRPTHLLASVAGPAAALVALAGMLLLRSTLQVRSVPERLTEWLLLFIPPSIFETVLQRLGFDAKRYALGVSVVVVLGLLGLLGYVVLRRGWPLLAIAGVGLGMWLFVMLCVMPLTSAGVFALDLLDGKRAAVSGYLAVSLSFAATLAIVRARLFRLRTYGALVYRPGQATRVWASALLSRDASQPRTRRSALALLGGAAAAWVGTYMAALLLPKQFNSPTVILQDPQESAPPGALDPPNSHQGIVAMASPGQPLPAPTPPPSSGQQVLPEPTAIRALSRDQDGAVLPLGRPRGQLAEANTSNDDFYIVTKNVAGDPIIHPAAWRILLDGEVERPFQLDYATLRRLPASEVTNTIECISNFVGKPELALFGAELISTARWKGVPVRDILGLVGGLKTGTTWVAVIGADEFTSALPLEVVMDPATLLVYEMNGQVLPREHGYPARLLVPGRYGMKNAKWVVGLRPMRREFTDWYGQRNWTRDALVRTMSRIDAPAPGARLPAGPSTLAGIAYAGGRGIARVEYSADGGTSWRDAELLRPPLGQNCWVRWRGEFELAVGAKITLVARATDGAGALQPEAFSLPEPDGGSGWPSIEIQSD